MAATAPAFVGLFTQSEATAAQRTFVFFAPDATDGFTAEPGLTYAGADCQISKNGGAFANLAGTVTEIASGFYQVVLAAGDLDTLGTFVITFADAAARTVQVCGQVIALDLNVATVALNASGSIPVGAFAAGAITAAAIASDAIGAAEIAADVTTELAGTLASQASVDALARNTKTDRYVYEGQLTTDNDAVSIDMTNALETVVELTGTFDGCTITIATSENPAAAVPLWTTATTKAAPASYTVSGPHAAVRCIVSNDGAATDVDVTFLVRHPK